MLRNGQKGQKMISSTSNPRIRKLCNWQSKAKERRKDGVFLAEGIKMLEEAPPSWIREVYLTEDALKKIEHLPRDAKQVLDKLNKTGYELVSDEVMKKCSDTQTPQGAIVVLDRPAYHREEMLSKKDGLFLIIEDLQDPGNLGTIVRTAEGAGVDGIFLSKDTVDLYNPKTIRSTMGSVYRMPCLYVDDLSEVLRDMKKRGISAYAAHLSGTGMHYDFSYKKGTAFMIGNEGNGLKKETADLADCYLKIPMEGKVESLNAAIATSVLLYEAYRQRRM